MHPELIESVTESGLTVLDVALASGDLSSVLAVVSHGATSAQWSPSPKMLPAYMAYVSGLFGAGWLDGIEFETYRMAFGRQPTSGWEYPVTVRQIDDLRMLSAEFDGWACWEGSVERFVPMEEWQTMFDEWTTGQGFESGA